MATYYNRFTLADIIRIARDNDIDPNSYNMSDQLSDLGLPDSPGIWAYEASDSFALPESDYWSVSENDYLNIVGISGSQKRLMDKAKSAYDNASAYYKQNRVALAKLWESLAAYYQAIAFDSDDNEVLAIFDAYGDYEAIVKRIGALVDQSLPSNISKRSRGGFGYHGDTPIGDTWGIVYNYAPNVAEIYQESNWETFIAELESVDPDSDNEYFTIERFGSWVTPTENLMVCLIDSSGKPTPASIVVCDLLERLENYPYLNEDQVSERESEQDYIEQLESIRYAISKVWLVSDNDLPKIWDDRANTYQKLEVVIWNWLYENDHEVIERNARGYQDSGYIKSDTPIIAALYAMGLLDLTSYDETELAELESELIDYAWNSESGIKNAFRTYKTKL